MNELKELLNINSASQIQSVSQLLALYEGTVDELRFCANIDPALEIDIDAADKREAELLNFEADLLDQAARIKLTSKEDVLSLMDMWAKVSGVDDSEQPSDSDRIAMNLFRHITGTQFSME